MCQTQTSAPDSAEEGSKRPEAVVPEEGVEPDPSQSTNRLMAHDFRRKTLILAPLLTVDRVPWRPLQSPGVDPCHGDILETEGGSKATPDDLAP